MGTRSRGAVARVEISSNVVTWKFLAKRRQDCLQRNHPLRRNTPAMEPHRHLGLPDATPGQTLQFLGDRDLPTGFLDGLSDPGNRMTGHIGAEYSTGSVIDVNTRSANAFRHTSRMPRSGETSDFWVRLCQARTSLGLSVRQDDVAKDYDVYQSMVTKWKTGKSMPQPERIRGMAKRLNVSFEWLHMGRGDMRAEKEIDAVAAQVLEIMEGLTPQGRIEVLKAAFTQQTLQMPAIAARLEQAQRAVHKPSRQVRKTG